MASHLQLLSTAIAGETASKKGNVARVAKWTRRRLKATVGSVMSNWIIQLFHVALIIRVLILHILFTPCSSIFTFTVSQAILCIYSWTVDLTPSWRTATHCFAARPRSSPSRTNPTVSAYPSKFARRGIPYSWKSPCWSVVSINQKCMSDHRSMQRIEKEC